MRTIADAVEILQMLLEEYEKDLVLYDGLWEQGRLTGISLSIHALKERIK